MSAALALPGRVPETRVPETSISGTRIEAAAFVLALRGRGVSDLDVLRAMETVPRELFAPRRLADLARQDVALPLPFGETMTAPAMVAAMLAALAPRPGMRVLEVGTGSGYVAALLAAIGCTVRSCERRESLAGAAAHRLRAAGLGSRVVVEAADGLGSERANGPYDRVLLDGTVASPPASVTARLAAGGRLVCGLSEPGVAPRLATVDRRDDGGLEVRLGQPIRQSRLVVNDGEPSATEV